MAHRRRPVLDGADRRHLVDHAQQRLHGIGVVRRILEHDDRQVGRIGNHLEMGERHLGPHLAAHHEDRVRRQHQQARCAGFLGHARDARRLVAAIGVDAVDHRQGIAGLLHGKVEHAALLIEGAGMDLGGMGVDRDRRDAVDPGDVTQMIAGRLLVDGEVVVEGEQRGRDHAGGHVVVEAGHPVDSSLAAWRPVQSSGSGHFTAEYRVCLPRGVAGLDADRREDVESRWRPRSTCR